MDKVIKKTNKVYHARLLLSKDQGKQSDHARSLVRKYKDEGIKMKTK
jgi:hypothetical protein